MAKMAGYIERLGEIAELRGLLKDAKEFEKKIKSSNPKDVERAEKLFIIIIAKIDQLNLELADVLIVMFKEMGMKIDEIPSWFRNPENKDELREAASKMRRLEDDEAKEVINIRNLASAVFRKAA